MKLVTYSYNQRQRVGILDGETVYRISFDVGMLGLVRRGVRPVHTSERYPLSDVVLHAPLQPHSIIAVGRNYADHAKELDNEVPEKPLLFAKMPGSVIGTGMPITWRRSVTEKVDWEGELAVIIGHRAHRVAEEDALKYVFGYTIANDVTARDLQDSESQWLRAKGLDTFCPMGPAIVLPDEIEDPQTLTIVTRVNDEEVQNVSTSQMIHTVPALISYISQSITLHPGDVILTGTPAGVGKGMKPPRFLKDGDTVTVAIDGIGELHNSCRVEDED
ncbi:MAG: fumarylacetoacetate hydrolase family protein [Chloroflexota bacterium]